MHQGMDTRHSGTVDEANAEHISENDGGLSKINIYLIGKRPGYVTLI